MEVHVTCFDCSFFHWHIQTQWSPLNSIWLFGERKRFWSFFELLEIWQRADCNNAGTTVDTKTVFSLFLKEVFDEKRTRSLGEKSLQMFQILKYLFDVDTSLWKHWWYQIYQEWSVIKLLLLIFSWPYHCCSPVCPHKNCTLSFFLVRATLADTGGGGGLWAAPDQTTFLIII